MPRAVTACHGLGFVLCCAWLAWHGVVLEWCWSACARVRILRMGFPIRGSWTHGGGVPYYALFAEHFIPEVRVSWGGRVCCAAEGQTRGGVWIKGRQKMRQGPYESWPSSESSTLDRTRAAGGAVLGRGEPDHRKDGEDE